MQMSDSDWQKRLDKEQFSVLREGSTEPAFSGTLLNNDKNGQYACGACGASLFDSDTKFDSGSGWPSFYDVKDTNAVLLKADTSLGEPRIEVRCNRCNSHLGHVFNDAPSQPTGVRFCINSAALSFKERSGDDTTD